MITSEKLTDITTALCEVQKELPTLGKDKSGYGYKYLTLDNIIESVKPILCKHGIIIIQSVSEKENGIIITTRLQHISGEYFQDSFSLPKTEMKGVNNVQALGASITYGRRYSLSAMLNIATDEDTDGTIKQSTENLESQIIALLKSQPLPNGADGWEKFHVNRKQDLLKYLLSAGKAQNK